MARGSVRSMPGVVATAYLLMRNCWPSCSAAMGTVQGPIWHKDQAIDRRRMSSQVRAGESANHTIFARAGGIPSGPFLQFPTKLPNLLREGVRAHRHRKSLQPGRQAHQQLCTIRQQDRIDDGCRLRVVSSRVIRDRAHPRNRPESNPVTRQPSAILTFPVLPSSTAILCTFCKAALCRSRSTSSK